MAKVKPRLEIFPGIDAKPIGEGLALVKGTDADVGTVLRRLADGASPADLLRELGVNESGLRAALSYALDIIKDERLAPRNVGSYELAAGITADNRVRFGRPVIKGTRIDAATILGFLAAGDSIDRVAEAYQTPREGILAVLGYAAALIGSERVYARP